MPATEEYRYDLPGMHKVFCASALALLATTVWMMWADYADEWRGFQRQAMAHIAERDKRQVEQIESNPEYEAKLHAAQEQLQLAEQQLSGRQSVIEEQEQELAALTQQAAATMRELRVKRAIRDVERAEYGLKVRDSAPQDEQDAARTEFDEAQRIADEFEERYKAEDFLVQQAKAKLDELTAAKVNAEKDLKKLQSDVDRLVAAISKIEPSNWFVAAKRDFMHWPIINGFNSPERIQQDWMPKLQINLGGMGTVDRFDRCRTCHYTIDAVDVGTNPAFPHSPGQKGDGTYAHPYASHPRLDLYLTSTSPHPLPKFGCTVCHEGQGSGTSFQNASHTPNDPNVQRAWEGEYSWFDNHFWEHPMYPDRFVESGCIKCHINVIELGVNSKWGATAPKVYRGYELVKTYGCFGCHEFQGYDGTKPIGPDLRLEPSTPEEAEKLANDPLQVAGTMRKVGPSLRHLASKTDTGWVEHWTEEPRRFRPSTRMPQFFKLTNQQDHDAERFNPLELAGMATYLLAKSQPLELHTPLEGYKPDAVRGKELFATKGCLACHTHADQPGVHQNHGPELTQIHLKLKPGEDGFRWLYTWIREPERHHPRTKMPNLFLEPEGEGEKLVDPAADIAAFLLKIEGSPSDYKSPAEYDEIAIDDVDLDELVRMFVGKLLTQEQINRMMQTGVYPIAKEKIKGDEIELLAEGSAFDAAEWKRRKLLYVGRKTITKYGCYGCHDIPNFETARPIGTALQDWGKKDRSRLAFEHIHEYLHHHGQPGLGLKFETISAADAKRLHVEPASGVRLSGLEPGASPIKAKRIDDGRPEPDQLQIDDVIVGFEGQPVADSRQFKMLLRSAVPGGEVTLAVWRNGAEHEMAIRPDGSTEDRVRNGLEDARREEFKDPADRDRELSAGFYYQSLLHHGRPGFLWQKLRQPRSYDYKMVETKPYDDRLRMPKFPFTEEDIDSIATFILGLLAEPPHVEYLYNPSGPAGAKIRGEYLLDQYNCAGCHMMDLPEFRYGADLDELAASDLSGEFPGAVDLLLRLKPPRDGLTGETHVVKRGNETRTLPVVAFRGITTAAPNPDDDPEDREYVAELWETLQVGGNRLVPTSKIIFPEAALKEIRPANGGKYAEWLAQHLFDTKQVQQIPLGWQAAPPTLYLEGIKVQTPWLFNFLRNPSKIRHTTVLRMPRFNMSEEEAQALANYFAAQDGAVYPYQAIDEREPEYLSERNASFHEQWPDKDHDYLTESWKVLNGPLCIKCHSVGGRQPVSTDPKDVRAPNLDLAGQRLRPDWMLLWLYKSPWITPYTSMPQNFPPGKKNLEELFGGDGNQQTIAVRDALMNYHRLLERDGRIVYDPPMAPMTATPDTGTAQTKPNQRAESAAESEGTK